MFPECLIRSFACKIHISCQINLTSQFSTRTSTIFFLLILTLMLTTRCSQMTHHTKTCLMACIMPFFKSPLMAFMGRINFPLLGKSSFIWIRCSHLCNTILLVGLNVLIEIIQDFFKCYLRNAIGPSNPCFITI